MAADSIHGGSDDAHVDIRRFFSLCGLIAGLLACASSGNKRPSVQYSAAPSNSPTSPFVDGGTTADAGVLDGSSSVSGIVKSVNWRGGAAGRRVTVSGQSATTGSDGRFTLTEVPSSYDVVIAEPDGATFSIYQALTRTDPVLSHKTTFNPSLDGTPYRASISGTLSGDFPFPVDSSHLATVYYAAATAFSSWQLGQPLRSGGPAFEPMSVAWRGTSSITGALIALGQIGTATTPWTSAYLATRPVSLSDGNAVEEALTLLPVGVGALAGSIKMYAGNGVYAVAASYHLPGAPELIALGQFPGGGSFGLQLPDLQQLGGDYCVYFSDTAGYASGRRCGGRLGMTDFSIQVQQPPQMLKPPTGANATRNTLLSWSGVAGGVYMVDLNPDNPTAAQPRVQVYTSATSLAWPDFEELGIAFPAGATYRCQVIALMPYTSIDDFASNHGLFATGVDLQMLKSVQVEVTLVQ